MRMVRNSVQNVFFNPKSQDKIDYFKVGSKIWFLQILHIYIYMIRISSFVFNTLQVVFPHPPHPAVQQVLSNKFSF